MSPWSVEPGAGQVEDRLNIRWQTRRQRHRPTAEASPTVGTRRRGLGRHRRRDRATGPASNKRTSGLDSMTWIMIIVGGLLVALGIGAIVLLVISAAAMTTMTTKTTKRTRTKTSRCAAVPACVPLARSPFARLPEPTSAAAARYGRPADPTMVARPGGRRDDDAPPREYGGVPRSAGRSSPTAPRPSRPSSTAARLARAADPAVRGLRWSGRQCPRGGYAAAPTGYGGPAHQRLRQPGDDQRLWQPGADIGLATATRRRRPVTAIRRHVRLGGSPADAYGSTTRPPATAAGSPATTRATASRPATASSSRATTAAGRATASSGGYGPVRRAHALRGPDVRRQRLRPAARRVRPAAAGLRPGAVGRAAATASRTRTAAAGGRLRPAAAAATASRTRTAPAATATAGPVRHAPAAGYGQQDPYGPRPATASRAAVTTTTAQQPRRPPARLARRLSRRHS